MSRQGAWSRVASNLWRYLKQDFSKKNYVGEDHLGHKFYEISNTRQNVARGFDPPPGVKDSQPGLEWQMWLKGTRRFPPSDEEIAFNTMRKESQLEQNTNQRTERIAPKVESEGRGAGDDRPRSYPKYDEMEIAPGAKKAN